MHMQNNIWCKCWSERPTSPDSWEADVDPVSISSSLVHQSQAAELRHLASVQELLWVNVGPQQGSVNRLPLWLTHPFPRLIVLIGESMLVINTGLNLWRKSHKTSKEYKHKIEDLCFPIFYFTCTVHGSCRSWLSSRWGRTSMASKDRLQEISNFFMSICSLTL